MIGVCQTIHIRGGSSYIRRRSQKGIGIPCCAQARVFDVWCHCVGALLVVRLPVCPLCLAFLSRFGRGVSSVSFWEGVEEISLLSSGWSTDISDSSPLLNSRSSSPGSVPRGCSSVVWVSGTSSSPAPGSSSSGSVCKTFSELPDRPCQTLSLWDLLVFLCLLPTFRYTC